MMIEWTVEVQVEARFLNCVICVKFEVSNVQCAVVYLMGDYKDGCYLHDSEDVLVVVM